MTLKNKLQSQIRGWFPQEPKTSKTIITNRLNENNQQAINSQEYKKLTTGFQNSEVLLPLSGLMAFTFLDVGQLSLVNAISLILTGLFIGTIFGAAPAYKELKMLSTKGVSSVKLSQRSTGAMIVLSLALIAAALVVNGTANFVAIRMVLMFSFAHFLANTVSKQSLFKAWEKKHNAYIMRGKAYTIISSPKPQVTTQKYFFGRKLKE